MHDEHGPRRLRQGNDTPEALLRAIDALRKGVDDGARLSRVGQKLEGVLNAPPTAATLPKPATQAAQRSGLFGQSSIKLILGGLALLVALTPLLFRKHSDDGAVPGADRDGSSAAPSSSTPIVAATPPPTSEIAAAQAVEQNAIAPAETAAASPAARRPAKHTARTRERAGAREAPSERVSNDEQAPPAAPKAESQSTPVEVEPSAAKEPQRPAAKLEQPKEATPIPAEADLLLKARKAVKLDPSLALRLADEHQSYYPKGRLVPEREVLAIEALRNLGRKQEADERLRKFEARYPKSIHLQRLHEAKSTEAK